MMYTVCNGHPLVGWVCCLLVLSLYIIQQRVSLFYIIFWYLLIYSFYIKDHHEPIISAETFARAQEIRERRNGGRKSATPGKREKYSWQDAFSCLLECGFCGANLSRRRWHSSSKYKKTIWQCVKSTKDGKRFCSDSKGIPEQVIEDAFIES